MEHVSGATGRRLRSYSRFHTLTMSLIRTPRPDIDAVMPRHGNSAPGFCTPPGGLRKSFSIFLKSFAERCSSGSSGACQNQM